MNTKRLIKNLIEKSDLSTGDKIEAEILLDKAFMSEENQSLRELIDVLEKLYKDLGDEDEFKDQDYSAPRYQKALLEVLKDYKSRIRKNDYVMNTEYFQPFDDYTPITLEGFLVLLGVVPEVTKDGKTIITFDDPDLLDKRIKVAEDDGHGYSPRGFKDAFSVYQDDDIILWV